MPNAFAVRAVMIVRNILAWVDLDWFRVSWQALECKARNDEAKSKFEWHRYTHGLRWNFRRGYCLILGMQPCVTIRHSYFLRYGHMVAITTVCAGVGLSLIVDPFFMLPSLIRQNFAAWSMSLSVILTVLTVIFSGIWFGLDGWAFIDWLLIPCIVAVIKKVIGIVQTLILLNLWSWFVYSW